MKKLLMLGAILALGAVAYGADAKIDEAENVAEANVTVKARLVAKNLVITDLEGNPLVLDFETVSKNRKSGTSEVQEKYLVRYVGDVELTDDNSKLAMSLKGPEGYVEKAIPVTLASLTQAAGEVADTFDVTVGLDSYAGVMPATAETGHDYAEYTGTIYGTLDFANANPKNNGQDANDLSSLASGDYQGNTMLKVTINGGNEFVRP